MSTDNYSSIYQTIEKETISNDFQNSTIPQDDLSGIYLFISIDLVNSTIFKTRFTKYWSFVIQSFYDIVKTALGMETYNTRLQNKYYLDRDVYDNQKIKTDGFRIWKLVGDEVLIYHKIVSVGEMLNTTQIMYEVTCGITKLFIGKAEDFFKTDNQSLKEFKNIAKRHLAAKTTMWIAKCGHEINLNFPNMFYDSSQYINFQETCLDFLGPDIDAGFRLCKYAEKNKVIISPGFMALLSVFSDTKKNGFGIVISSAFRIVSYVELEDIWEKRLYPIFMYCPDVDNSAESLTKWKSLFEYDECSNSRLSDYIFREYDAFLTEEYSVKRLDKIYKELGRFDEIEDLKKDFITQIKLLENKTIKALVPYHKFEFHISCACYNSKQEKIWIENHKNHGLSFGCIMIDINHDYKKTVVEKYKEKHNIVIDFGSEEQFISFYSVNRKNNTEEILGIILFVEAVTINNNDYTQKNGWYTISALKKKIKKDNSIHRIAVFDKVIEKIEGIVSNDECH